MFALQLKRTPRVSLEADIIKPEMLWGKTEKEIAELELWHGQDRVFLGDFFSVQKRDEQSMLLEGELQKVRGIGRGMQRGSILIKGQAGQHLGSYMRGGEIRVWGDVGDWLGAGMTGGSIVVQGNCGDYLGAAYGTERSGLNRGFIHVYGNVGNRAGEKMRRGIVFIGGRAGDYAGSMMGGGTLILMGGVGRGVGIEMKRGSIVSFSPVWVMPTFSYCCRYEPVFMKILAQKFQELEIGIKDFFSPLLRFIGDGSGKGEILTTAVTH